MGIQKPATADGIRLHGSLVFNEDGAQVMLGNLWHKQSVILVFLRHFACIGCRAHAADVWKNRSVYEKAGAKIVFIGNGAHELIKMFKQDLNMTDATLFTDPTLNSFKAAGLKRNLFSAFSPKSLMNAHQLDKEGHKHGVRTKESGDLWQLGGIVAIKPGSVVTYQYISDAVGDYPDESSTNNELRW